MSNVVAVQTRGSQNNRYWVTLFRLELSQDCVTFRPLLDVSGSNLVNDYAHHFYYNVNTQCSSHDLNAKKEKENMNYKITKI